MGDDGYFVRHGYRGAVEFGGFGESETVGERAGFVKLLLVFETENVVYGAAEERENSKIIPFIQTTAHRLIYHVLGRN